MTITLYGSTPVFGLPEASPFVTKAEIQLRLADLPYRKLPAKPSEGPKEQIPFIEDEGEVIGDSTFIRRHVERKYSVDLDAGLDPAARAQSWAIERMLENQLYWAMVYFRYRVPENFAKGPAHFFDPAPEELRPKLREELLQTVTGYLRANGVGRHSPAEVVELGTRSFTALAELLGDKPYLMGSRPTALDAAGFGMLAGVLTPYFETPLRESALRFGTLTRYVDRMMAEFHPEQGWQKAGL
jgi:glutathione S-transferase